MNSNHFDHIIQEFATPLTNPVLIFSLILLIILLAPILLRPIKVPGIIGLILSGVLIGPYGLNILQKTSAIELFSTIGLLYIMFIAGLELDIDQFKKYKHKSLLFGFFTFIVPLGIGYPVCHYLLGYPVDASFLTASMFATHTLVSYPILSKFGLTKIETVAVAVGGTILTDTAVLIILAVVMGAGEGNIGLSFWIQLMVSLTIFSGIMFWVIPRVAKWFFRKLESEKTSHYIFVLAVVFFAAFLAEMAGVEPIIGAFVAGLSLNRLIPHSSALMNRIEFIGNALFIPFFLISVGMLVDVKVLVNGANALIVAAVLTVVALAGKWLAAFLTQRFVKYSSVQRQLIFGLSSAHAAATLAVILVGYDAGIIDKNILNGTILLILVTCLVSSFVTEAAAKKMMVATRSQSIVNPTTGYESFQQHILLPIANIANMEVLLDFAILIKGNNTNPLTVLTVVPNNQEAETNLQTARKNLESTVKLASATETDINIMATIDHNVSGGIARTSKEIMADHIIMGWPKKPGILENYIGDKTENILNSTNKGVYICHFERPLTTHKKILLICPPFSELEKGFFDSLAHACKLAKELALPIICYSDTNTADVILSFKKQFEISTNIAFKATENWEDLLVLLWDISKEDIFIFIAARKGSISHRNYYEKIPAKIEKHMQGTSRIILYPEAHAVQNV